MTRLELGGHHAKAGGEAEDEAVAVDELRCSDDGVVRLGRGMHLGEHLLRECLRDLHERPAASEL